MLLLDLDFLGANALSLRVLLLAHLALIAKVGLLGLLLARHLKLCHGWL